MKSTVEDVKADAEQAVDDTKAAVDEKVEDAKSAVEDVKADAEQAVDDTKAAIDEKVEEVKAKLQAEAEEQSAIFTAKLDELLTAAEEIQNKLTAGEISEEEAEASFAELDKKIQEVGEEINAFDAELQEKAQAAGVDLNDDKQDEIEPEEIEAIEIAAEEIEAEEIEAIEIEAEDIIAEEYADEIDFLMENVDPETLMLAIEAGIAEQEAADAENAAELRKFFDEIKSSMEKSQNDGKSEAVKEEMNLEDLMKAIEKGIAEEEAENAKAAAQLREFYESIKTTLEKSKAAESK